MMKKVLYIAGVLGMIISCGKLNVKDCGKEAREWAELHVELYEKAPRQELVALPWERQRSVYSRLSPAKRVELWKEKVKLVKSASMYPAEILSDLEALFDVLSPECYYDESNLMLENFEAAARIWLDKMENVYGLSREEIHFLAYTWMTEEEYYESKALDSPIPTKGDYDPGVNQGDQPLCECSDFHDCLRRACDTRNSKCKEPTDKACGVGGIYVCTHMCL